MARSKSGGTRSFIRGRVGADVYTIGKDGAGKKQQVIRSLAEQVANPRTVAQMRNRMIMSTVMQAQSALASIIDHSFDGVSPGQPSISHFIKENFRILSGNSGLYNEYRQKGMHSNPLLLSDGNVPSLENVYVWGCTDTNNPNFHNRGCLVIRISKSSITAGDIREAMGIQSEGDYFTTVFNACGVYDEDAYGHISGFLWFETPMVRIMRVSVTNTLADDAEITSANVKQMFTVEINDGNYAISVDTNNGVTEVCIAPSTHTEFDGRQVNGDNFGEALIITRKKSDGYEHSRTLLTIRADEDWNNYSDALATYPTGESKFLNGGEL